MNFKKDSEATFILKSITLLFTLQILVFTNVFSQKPEIVFEKMMHDFGKIKEEKGPVSYRYWFTNKGGSPLRISKVVAGCGCTTPGWSDQAVDPGKKGYVDAEFNPLGRPGKFEKSLTVLSNATNQGIILNFKGEVIPKPVNLNEDYPVKIGPVRMMSNYLNLGMASTYKPTVSTFKVYNDTTVKLTYTSFSGLPAYVKMTLNPKIILPKQTGTITVTYDGGMKNDYGYFNDPVFLNIKEAKSKPIDLYIVANIENVPRRINTKESETNPKIVFDSLVKHFGEVPPQSSTQLEYVFHNKGKGDLKIHKIGSSCGCTVPAQISNVIPPGGTEKIPVTYSSKGKRPGPVDQTITVYTNDLTNPTIRLQLKGSVVDKPIKPLEEN